LDKIQKEESRQKCENDHTDISFMSKITETEEAKEKAFHNGDKNW
jgi:hypothetical protein